ncbi:hypothetical protein [Pseudofrankia inefficax]|uniref:Uncharacterized protein n=1 Tax=Pseudofrankia inefficax (strain DSM 45817 / CECT 9037 / DDB 130130 / EuI1c) TaxID=298654 RepID=E3J8W7_PSEI1|nr:hypothetical protein [Pseudofrankia inefficax]ADP79700.1 hypothetical protein FraEuI1c_1643 [Pseudofrankia inefficax]
MGRRGLVDVEAQADAMAHMRRAARSLRAFDVDTFTLDSAGPRTGRDPEPGSDGDHAVVAAGALITACTTFVDDLCVDIAALLMTRVDAVAADVVGREDGPLSRLPQAYGDHYTVDFARRLLVATVSVTGRLAEPDWIPIACLAEQLALYLVVEEAASLLDRYGLDDDPRARYQFFEEQAFENDAHLRLFDEAPELAGSRAGDPISAWFTPFYDGFYVHPYVEPRF